MISPIFLFRQLKNKRPLNKYPLFLKRYRTIAIILVLSGLLGPFVLQQTFYPFFRFGMFAEPIRREIQQEMFALSGIRADGSYEIEISAYTGINKSNLDYLLRNYYYRDEAHDFLRKISELMDASPFDTITILRIIKQDTSVVARYPTWR